MRTIRLCRGPGNGIDTACLATAVAMLAGEPEHRDSPECLCPVIRSFVVATNDAMNQERRSKLYGDLPWLLIGTNNGCQNGAEVEKQRALVAADYAVRVFAPFALGVVRMDKEAQQLRSLPKVCSPESAQAAAVVIGEMLGVLVGRSVMALHTFYFQALNCARNALHGAIYNGFSEASDASARAVMAASEMADHSSDDLWEASRQCILDMAAIGSRTPIEPAYTPKRLAEVLA